MQTVETSNLEEIEINVLLEALFQHTGYDFRQYTHAVLRQRIRDYMQDVGLSTISGLQERILHDVRVRESFLHKISGNQTELFRNPTFYLGLRDKLSRLYANAPYIRIWCPACVTGGEVYSLAIVLLEESLYNKTVVYATDMSQKLVDDASVGRYPLDALKSAASRYMLAGGKTKLVDYYAAHKGMAILKGELGKNIVWGQHNLATDSSFNEFDVIVCRNSLRLFNPVLQEHVHRLFYESLRPHGLLCLDNHDELRLSSYSARYENIDKQACIFRKLA